MKKEVKEILIELIENWESNKDIKSVNMYVDKIINLDQSIKPSELNYEMLYEEIRINYVSIPNFCSKHNELKNTLRIKLENLVKKINQSNNLLKKIGFEVIIKKITNER